MSQLPTTSKLNLQYILPHKVGMQANQGFPRQSPLKKLDHNLGLKFDPNLKVTADVTDELL